MFNALYPSAWRVSVKCLMHSTQVPGNLEYASAILNFYCWSPFWVVRPRGVCNTHCSKSHGWWVQCPKTRWRACEACQRQLREANLEDEYALQSWFVGRINKFLRAQGRQLIGWDEILEGGLSPGAMVMSWRVHDALPCSCCHSNLLSYSVC